MTPLSLIIAALRDRGWPGMTEMQAYGVIQSSGIRLSSLRVSVSSLLRIVGF